MLKFFLSSTRGFLSLSLAVACVVFIHIVVYHIYATGYWETLRGWELIGPSRARDFFSIFSLQCSIKFCY